MSGMLTVMQKGRLKHAICFLMAVLAYECQAQVPDTGLKLVLYGSNNSPSIGTKSYVVKVALCNPTKDVVSVHADLMPQDYYLRFVVKDGAGKVIPYIGPEYRRKLKSKTELVSGKCLEYVFDLGEMFGLYGHETVDVTAIYFDNLVKPQDSEVNIISNSITIR